MRRSLYAGVVALGLILGSTGTALAGPAHDYAGSRTPRSEKHRVPSGSLSGAQKKIVGPDVSNHNGCAIDWAAVARRRDFAFMKASEGITFTDWCFVANYAGPGSWRESRAVHIPRGAYDFGRPHADLSTARAEADHYVRVVKSVGGFHHALPPVLDVEVNDDGINRHQMRRWIKAWIQRVRAHTKRKTITIYTGNWWWGPNVGKWKPKGALLWASCYCSSWRVNPVAAWGKPNWWQYTDGVYGPKPHKAPGIGYTDQSFWLGSKSALLALTQKP